MKKKILNLLIISAFVLSPFLSLAQNVGVNTTTPEASLDINGDIRIRSVGIAVANGITLALDVNSARYSNYRITGPTSDFTLAGITASIDGRLVTLFNYSGFTMELVNQDATALLTDQIVTGTNANLSLINMGIVTLQYDGVEEKWIVKSSSRAGAAGAGGNWEISGNNIFNTNSGNVGIGTATPGSILSIQTPINTAGFTHIGGADSIIVSEGIGGVSASIGTLTAHAFRLNTGGQGRIHIYPTGDVVVGTNVTASYGRFTVETGNNSWGISHKSTLGNIIATQIGGTSAGIGTFSPTNMRIFCNSVTGIFIAEATMNVGIGTDNPTYKLSVNGNVRAKEVVVETGWADYVFNSDYPLPSIPELESYITRHKHLPNIPSAAEVEEKGLHLGDTQKRMMEKIEELTLYIINLYKRLNELEKNQDKLSKQ